MKDKYVWWGLLGIGVAFLLYFMTKGDIQKQSVKVPYLVPSALPPEPISEQSNIIGSHPGSVHPNPTPVPSGKLPYPSGHPYQFDYDPIGNERYLVGGNVPGWNYNENPEGPPLGWNGT